MENEFQNNLPIASVLLQTQFCQAVQVWILLWGNILCETKQKS